MTADTLLDALDEAHFAGGRTHADVPLWAGKAAARISGALRGGLLGGA